MSEACAHTFLLASKRGIAFPGSAAPVGRVDSLKFRIGYLFLVSQATPIGEAIAQLEYDVRFLGVDV